MPVGFRDGDEVAMLRSLEAFPALLVICAFLLSNSGSTAGGPAESKIPAVGSVPISLAVGVEDEAMGSTFSPLFLADIISMILVPTAKKLIRLDPSLPPGDFVST